METTPAYIRLEGIDKQFGPTRALRQMDLEIRLGEVIGLVGPNGAGKSTLMKVLTGAYEPTAGSLACQGRLIPPGSYGTHEAKAHGIACAYQELSLCTNLTVYENFLVSRTNHLPFARLGMRRRAAEAARLILDSVFPSHGIDVTRPVDGLTLAQRQMVEIAKAMSVDGLKILVLDEPTSSLSGDRITQLHAAVRELARRQVAVIYISHKLDEIEKVCDRIVVMKSGTACWKGAIAETSMADLVEILGGKLKVVQRGDQEDTRLPVVLELKRLATRELHGVSMHARKGEIIGISGFDGSGQKELIQEIFKASRDAPRSARRRGIDLRASVSYVSGDRQNEGIFPLWDIADNTVISSLGQVSRRGFVLKARLNALAKVWYDNLKFTALGIHDDIMGLSGGNQQKALLARGLASNADLILLNDPTCGVDIETKQEIYKLMDLARKEGRCVLLHSTEDLEMEQCDRVYVMHEGSVAAELIGDQVSVQNIIKTSFTEKTRKRQDPEAPPAGPAEEPGAGKPGLAGRVLGNRAFLAFATLFAIFIVNSFLNPRILSYVGVQLLYSSAIPLVFVALGQMFMVITGGIDLGNGLSLGLMNVIVAFVVTTHPLLGAACLALVVLGYAALAAIIQSTKIPAIVITLGASFVWLGIALIVSPIPGGSAPEWLSAIYNFHFPVVPMPLVLAALAALGSWWVVKKSKYGMIINGIGNNPVAITRAGWSQMTAMVVTYSLSGLMVVLGSFMLTVVSNSGDCNATRSYNMLSIATIILGGCEFAGGISSPVGVVAAALAISSISFLLTFIGIDSNYQSAVTGLILIAALTWKLFSGKLEAKRWA